MVAWLNIESAKPPRCAVMWVGMDGSGLAHSFVNIIQRSPGSNSINLRNPRQIPSRQETWRKDDVYDSMNSGLSDVSSVVADTCTRNGC
jgi:hypothetical protein